MSENKDFENLIKTAIVKDLLKQGLLKQYHADKLLQRYMIKNTDNHRRQ